MRDVTYATLWLNRDARCCNGSMASLASCWSHLVPAAYDDTAMGSNASCYKRRALQATTRTASNDTPDPRAFASPKRKRSSTCEPSGGSHQSQMGESAPSEKRIQRTFIALR